MTAPEPEDQFELRSGAELAGALIVIWAVLICLISGAVLVWQLAVRLLPP